MSKRKGIEKDDELQIRRALLAEYREKVAALPPIQLESR